MAHWVALLLSCWPLYQAAAATWNIPPYRWGMVLLFGGTLVFSMKRLYESVAYEFEFHESALQAKLGTMLSIGWFVVSVVCSGLSFMQTSFGFLAFAAALCGLMTERYPFEGRLRYLVWFACLSFPAMWQTSYWTSLQSEINERSSWVASVALDDVPIPFLRERTEFDLGIAKLDLATTPGVWWSLETLLSMVALLGIWFARPFLSLCLTYQLVQFSYPLFAGHLFAIHAIQVQGGDQFFGLPTAIDWWLIVGVAFVGTILIERACGELGNPIVFSAFDTSAPSIVEIVSRIISFPNSPPASDSITNDLNFDNEPAEEIDVDLLGKPIGVDNTIQVIRLEEQSPISIRNPGLRTKDDVGS